MNFIKNLAIFLLAIVVGAALSWLGLWIANIFNYLLSLPIGFIGIALDTMPDGVLKFIYEFISYGLAFGVVFYLAQCVLTSENLIFMEETPVLTRILVIMLTVLMIVVLDYRFDPFLPQFLVDGLDFLRDECGVYLLTPINWVEVLDGGSELGDIEHTVCDITYGLGGILALFYNWWDNN